MAKGIQQLKADAKQLMERHPMKHFPILLLVLFASCSKPAAKEPEAETNEASAPAADSAPAPEAKAEAPATPPKASRETHSIKGTGVTERFLLASLNNTLGIEPKYHHEFFYVMTTEPPASIRVFADKRTTIKLMLTGPSDDLELINLVIPTNDFFTEKNGKPTGEGAAAFGRCVRKMGMAVDRSDPSWGNDLYDWMNKNMMAGILEPGGITITHRHLLAKFQTMNSDNIPVGISMMIGTPAKE